MNGTFIDEQAEEIANRFTSPTSEAETNLETLYLHLFNRVPSPAESSGLLSKSSGNTIEEWALIAKALLSSNEFLFID